MGDNGCSVDEEAFLFVGSFETPTFCLFGGILVKQAQKFQNTPESKLHKKYHTTPPTTPQSIRTNFTQPLPPQSIPTLQNNRQANPIDRITGQQAQPKPIQITRIPQPSLHITIPAKITVSHNHPSTQFTPQQESNQLKDLQRFCCRRVRGNNSNVEECQAPHESTKAGMDDANPKTNPPQPGEDGMMNGTVDFRNGNGNGRWVFRFRARGGRREEEDGFFGCGEEYEDGCSDEFLE